MCSSCAIVNIGSCRSLFSIAGAEFYRDICRSNQTYNRERGVYYIDVSPYNIARIPCKVYSIIFQSITANRSCIYRTTNGSISCAIMDIGSRCSLFSISTTKFYIHGIRSMKRHCRRSCINYMHGSRYNIPSITCMIYSIII